MPTDMPIEQAGASHGPRDSPPSHGGMRDWFDALEGAWRLDRRILDTDRGAPDAAGPASMRARLRGEARFHRVDADTLAYTEEGVLALANGARLRAVRHYVYRRDGAALLVEFADGPDVGRRFLRFDAVNGTGECAVRATGRGAVVPDWQGADRHLCGRDLYRAWYRFHGFADACGTRRIIQRTVVDGPRKAYAIVTRLRPLGRA